MWCFLEEKNMWIKGQWYQFTFYLLPSKVTEIYTLYFIHIHIFSINWQVFEVLKPLWWAICNFSEHKKNILKKVLPHKLQPWENHSSKQESIPVGCLSPTFLIGRTPPDNDPLYRDSPGQRLSPWKEHVTRERDHPRMNKGKGSQTGSDTIQRPLWADRHLSKHYLVPNFVCAR